MTIADSGAAHEDRPTTRAPDLPRDRQRRPSRARAWIALRTGLPCASGLWVALVLRSPGGNAWRLVLSAVFLAMLGVGLWFARSARPPQGGRVQRQPRWQTALLALAVVAGSLSFVLAEAGQVGVVRVSEWIVALAAAACLVVNSVQDWQIQDIARRRYALLALPWLMAGELGVLGGWLTVRGLVAGPLHAGDQRLLSVVMLIIMFELLIFLRWVVPASPNDVLPREPLRGERARATTLTHLRSWGGRILQSILLLLTITNEGVYFAAAAWLLVLGGHVIRYYVLTDTFFSAKADVSETPSA